ncbi:MAG: Uma2 family endonuclease [Hormoscilla sp. GM7CHS1pb]|nr:Uma2 family endonuclease [Hormoscilla sp. GM7CHS1pb]
MVAATFVCKESNVFSLEDYMLDPPDRMEWVDGILVEKNGKTAKHGRIQARLAAYWIDYNLHSARQTVVRNDYRCIVLLRTKSFISV